MRPINNLIKTKSPSQCQMCRLTNWQSVGLEDDCKTRQAKMEELEISIGEKK